MKKTRLAQRVEMARAAMEFALVMGRNKLGQPTHIQVPGHAGKRYEQFIRRNDNRQSGLTVECQLNTGCGPIPCPGNNGHICYHSLSAVELAVKESGKKASWCQTREIADLRARMGGQVIPVQSWKGTGILYAVVEDI